MAGTCTPRSVTISPRTSATPTTGVAEDTPTATLGISPSALRARPLSVDAPPARCA